MTKVTTTHISMMQKIRTSIIEAEKEELKLLNKIGMKGIKMGWAFNQSISYDLQYLIISNELKDKDNEDNFIKLLEWDYLVALERLYEILDRQGSVYLKKQWELIENKMYVQFIPYQLILIEKLMRETVNPINNKYLSNQKLRSNMRDKVKVIENYIGKHVPIEKLDSFKLAMKLLSETYNNLIMKDLYLAANKQEYTNISIINRQNVLHYYMNLDELNERDFHQLMFIIICMIELYDLLGEIKVNE